MKKNTALFVSLTFVFFTIVDTNSQKTVHQLIVDFDDEFSKMETVTNNRFKSSGAFQEYYYGDFFFEANLKAWQATGDIKYFNRMKGWIDDMMRSAIVINEGSGAGCKGWLTTDIEKYGIYAKRSGQHLWEYYTWRHVAQLLRIIHQSPLFKKKTEAIASNWYNNVLNFIEVNIWEKWHDFFPDVFYRNIAHIATHSMAISHELYIITNENRYKKAYEAISHKGMPNWDGSRNSFRNILELNPNTPSAYVWQWHWNKADGTNSVQPRMQDTTHSDAIISNLLMLWEQGNHWTDDDMLKFTSAWQNVIYEGIGVTDFSFWWNIDGTSPNDGFTPQKYIGKRVPQFKLQIQGWLLLGQFDATLQLNMENNVKDKQHKQPYSGFLAYNRKLLNDGRPVYPEFYYPVNN